MTTNSMSCELFGDQLMPYLEHEVDDVTRLAVEDVVRRDGEVGGHAHRVRVTFCR